MDNYSTLLENYIELKQMNAKLLDVVFDLSDKIHKLQDVLFIQLNIMK